MDLDDIRMFVKVAELKSFVAAATELRVQNSSLSRSVARLEANLGVRLLQRTTRRVSLTEEGERFLAETSVGLGHLQGAVDSLHALRGEPKGRIRMASPIEIGQHLVEHVLPDFFLKYPEISVEWDFFGSSRSLLEHGIDLSIRTLPSQEQSVIEKQLGKLSLKLYRSPKFAWPFKNVPTIKQLEALPWVIFTRNNLDSAAVKFKIHLDGDEVELRPKHIRFRTNSFVAVRHAIGQGLGVGHIPSPLAATGLASGQLIAIQPKKIYGLPLQFYAVYPSRQYLAPRVRVLLDWLIDNFPSDASVAT